MGPATTAVVAWLVAAMTAWSPVNREHIMEEAKETQSSGLTRYNEIAGALVKVTYDPARSPIYTMNSDHARAAASLLELSMAFFESGFRRDVDLGLGKYGRGDGGRSHCMMQIQLGTDRKDTAFLKKLLGKEWSADDLVTDRTKCFLVGYEMALRSIKQCHALPFEQRLSAYARGNCESKEGHEISEQRIHKARKWYSGHKPTVNDADVMAELFPTAVGGGTVDAH